MSENNTHKKPSTNKIITNYTKIKSSQKMSTYIQVFTKTKDKISSFELYELNFVRR